MIDRCFVLFTVQAKRWSPWVKKKNEIEKNNMKYCLKRVKQEEEEKKTNRDNGSRYVSIPRTSGGVLPIRPPQSFPSCLRRVVPGNSYTDTLLHVAHTPEYSRSLTGSHGAVMSILPEGSLDSDLDIKCL